MLKPMYKYLLYKHFVVYLFVILNMKLQACKPCVACGRLRARARSRRSRMRRGHESSADEEPEMRASRALERSGASSEW